LGSFFKSVRHWSNTHHSRAPAIDNRFYVSEALQNALATETELDYADKIEELKRGSQIANEALKEQQAKVIHAGAEIENLRSTIEKTRGLHKILEEQSERTIVEKDVEIESLKRCLAQADETLAKQQSDSAFEALKADLDREQLEIALDRVSEDLKEELALREPLAEIGVAIRKRFLEYCKRARQDGNFISVDGKIDLARIQAGSEAAHRGNIAADAALFQLSVHGSGTIAFVNPFN